MNELQKYRGIEKSKVIDGIIVNGVKRDITDIKEEPYGMTITVGAIPKPIVTEDTECEVVQPLQIENNNPHA